MLKTILVDDNRFCVQLLREICKASSDVDIVGSFTNSLEALSFIENHRVDFAFLEIDMAHLDGIDLGKRLRERYPDIVLIFVSTRGDRCLEAMQMKADFYISKPINPPEIMDAIERAKLLSVRQRKKPIIHTFGRFDVFVDRKVVHFPNAKSKELLALCVDRQGGDVTMEEAVDVLWPDKPYDDRVKALYRKAVMKLKNTLDDAKIGHVFKNHRGVCHIYPDVLQCDYYDFLDGKPFAVASFHQEYMFEYSWAEETNAKLCSK